MHQSSQALDHAFHLSVGGLLDNVSLAAPTPLQHRLRVDIQRGFFVQARVERNDAGRVSGMCGVRMRSEPRIVAWRLLVQIVIA